MEKNVVEFFKRNPQAAAAHIVLNSIFDNAGRASRYRKRMNARKVSMVLRTEYEAWLAEQAATATTDEPTTAAPAGEVVEVVNNEQEQTQ